MPQLNSFLRYALWAVLASVPILASHRWGINFWQADAPDGLRLWDGFYSSSLFLVDAAIWAGWLLLAVMLVRLADWRETFTKVLETIINRYGGLWWVLLAFWMFLSVLWAREPNLARYDALHLVLELGIAMGVATYVVRGGYRGLLWVFLVGSAFYSLMAIAQIANGGTLGLTWLGEVQRSPDDPFGFGPDTFRGSALAFHPNVLSGVLVMAIFSCLVLLREARERASVALLLGLGLLVGLGLLATTSRIAIAATGLMLIVLWVAQPPIRLPARVYAGLGTLGLLIVGGVLAFGGDFGAALRDRITSLPTQAFQYNRLTYAYDPTLEIFNDGPLLGAGSDNLMLEIAQNPPITDDPLLPAHNIYLAVAGELGLVGAILLALATISLLWWVRPRIGAAAFVWGCGLWALFGAMLFDFYLWGYLNTRTFYLWAIGLWWGLALIGPLTTQDNPHRPHQDNDI